MVSAGVRPDAIISGIRRSLDGADGLPSRTTFLEHAPDIGGEDAGIKLPLVSIQPISNIRLNRANTDQVDVLTDTNGNHIGRVFTAEYRLDLQLDVWVASGSSYDVQTLGNAMHTALYEHDTHGPGVPLQDADGNAIDSIWGFVVNDGEPANDMGMTPSLLRWRQDVSVWAFSRFDTSEDYVTAVEYPSDDEFTDMNGNDVVSNVDESGSADW